MLYEQNEGSVGLAKIHDVKEKIPKWSVLRISGGEARTSQRTTMAAQINMTAKHDNVAPNLLDL